MVVGTLKISLDRLKKKKKKNTNSLVEGFNYNAQFTVGAAMP